jgi:hypothetical protein
MPSLHATASSSPMRTTLIGEMRAFMLKAAGTDGRRVWRLFC